MRCHEIRTRIEHDRNWSTEPEVKAHLADCPQCGELVRRAELMTGLLTRAAEDDTGNLMPFELQRDLVERRLASPVDRRRLPKASRKGQLGVAAAAVAIALVVVFVSLVPLPYDQVVGYDLRLVGVSRELADDDEALCNLLDTLGLFEAGVDVHGCDTTCHLSILDLKSHREARLVAGAISRLNESGLTSRIIPIRYRTSGSLLEKANRLLRGVS